MWWTGWGCLAPFVGALGFLLASIGALVVAAFTRSMDTTMIVLYVAGLFGGPLGAWFTWTTGRDLNRGTGDGPHTLYSIPFEYWAVLPLAGSVYIALRWIGIA